MFITCHRCLMQMEVDPNYAGQSFHCLRCQEVLQVPSYGMVAAPQQVQPSAPILIHVSAPSASSRLPPRKDNTAVLLLAGFGAIVLIAVLAVVCTLVIESERDRREEVKIKRAVKAVQEVFQGAAEAQEKAQREMEQRIAEEERREAEREIVRERIRTNRLGPASR